MYDQQIPINRGVCRCESPVSAVTISSCLISSCREDNEDDASSVLSCELLSDQLKEFSSPENKKPSRRGARSISPTGGKERNTRKSNSSTRKDTNQHRTSWRRRSPAPDSVVRRFVSSIFSTDDSDDDKNHCDCISTVSSLGMSFLIESSDDELLHTECVDDASTYFDGMHQAEEESSIVRVMSQIKMLRKSSIERFRATAISGTPKMSCKGDTIPTLPASLRARRDSLQDLSLKASILDDQTSEDEHFQSTLTERYYSTPSPQSCLIELPDDHKPHNEDNRSSSLPENVSKLMESDPSLSKESHSFEEHVLTLLSPLRRNFSTCTDRWCCSAASMIRDSELVRQSFERAKSLRNDQTDNETIYVVEKDLPSSGALPAEGNEREGTDESTGSPVT
jgi:hypothetical protein